MPMDGITLGFIARDLAAALEGGRVDRVTQPERDEILLTIRSQGVNHTLLLCASANNARAHLTRIKKNNPLEPPMFCMLLRKYIVGSRVERIRQLHGDRILEILLEGHDELGDRVTRTLVCEFMGKHSNLILVGAGGRIIESARHVTPDISRVREILPGLPFEPAPGQDKLPYDRADAPALEARLRGMSGALHKALAQTVSGLSALTAREMAFRIAGDEEARLEQIDVAAAARTAAELLQALPGMARPALMLSEDGTPLEVLAFPHLCREHMPCQPCATLSEAMDEFFRARDRSDRIKQKSAALHRVLKNNLERCEKKQALQLEALRDSERMEEYRIKGELLSASLHLIQRGQKLAQVPNYYEEGCPTLEIALDERISPAANAQRYFKLYQKARSAQKLAAEQKIKTEEELRYLDGQLDMLERCETEAELNEIREELEQLQYVRANHNRRQIKKLPPSQPSHYLSSEGVDILVGRNNVQNDRLTQSADPNEYWLHAKDMPGSHVIVLSEDPGEQTLLEAALLAAHHSKGRGSSQVPVDYTRRKYVRKPSGAKPGFVIYTHQHTLYVTPDEQALAAIVRVAGEASGQRS